MTTTRDAAARRPRHRGRVVSGRDRHDTARARRVVELAQLVQRPARLERTRLLQILALENETNPDAFAEARRKRGRRVDAAGDPLASGTNSGEVEHQG